MTMEKLILLLFVALGLLGELQAQDITQAYNELKEKSETTTAGLEEDYTYFLKIAEPFYLVEQKEFAKVIPPYLLKLYDYKTESAGNRFLNYNYNLLADLYYEQQVNIRIKENQLYNIEEAGTDATLKTSKYILKYQEDFEALATAILDKYEEGLKIKISENGLKNISETKKMYEKKYAQHYRNRNILEYFINGGISGSHKQKIEKRTGSFGIIQPPARTEVIALANPIPSVAFPSFKGFREDNSSLYVMVQVLGLDYHLKDFDNFIGFSIFHASPVNMDFAFFEHPIFGLEAHYNNNFNLGFGLEYNALTTSEGKEGYTAKLFLSVALYDNWKKRRDVFLEKE